MQSLTNAKRYAAYQSVEDALKSDPRYGLLSRYVDPVSRFLLLAHQARDSASVFKALPSGRVVPVFRKGWLSKCLPAALKSGCLHDIAVSWVSASGWALPAGYFRVVRLTVQELEDLGFGSRWYLEDAGKELEDAVARLAVPGWWRVVVSADGTTATVVREYPGWFLELEYAEIFDSLRLRVAHGCDDWSDEEDEEQDDQQDEQDDDEQDEDEQQEQEEEQDR